MKFGKSTVLQHFVARFAHKWSTFTSRTGSNKSNTGPLTRDEFESLLDPTSGQLSECGERELRKAVFERGIECDLRATVWPIILNVYPDGLSKVQRESYMHELALKYRSLKCSWQRRLKLGYAHDEQMRIAANGVRKDVVRTDRNHPFFSDDDENCGNAHSLALFNILFTYALAHPSVGYCQGMSDLAAPLLVVARGVEADAYICFCALMQRLRANFLCDGESMTRKFADLTRLLAFYDAVFFEYLREEAADDLLFCYRWMLLELKREFRFDDALVVMETIWSCISSTKPKYALPLCELNLETWYAIPAPTASVPIGGARIACESPEMSTIVEEENDGSSTTIGQCCTSPIAIIRSSAAANSSSSCPSVINHQLEQHNESSQQRPRQHMTFCHAAVMRSLMLLGDKSDAFTRKHIVNNHHRRSVDDLLLSQSLSIDVGQTNARGINGGGVGAASERRLTACNEQRAEDNDDGQSTTVATVAIIDNESPVPVAVEVEADSDDTPDELTLDDIYNICVLQQSVLLSDVMSASSAYSESRSRRISGQTDSGSSNETQESRDARRRNDDAAVSHDSGLPSGATTPYTQMIETMHFGGKMTAEVKHTGDDDDDDDVEVVNVKVRDQPLQSSSIDDGSSFLVFVCVTMLLEDRDNIMRKNMEMNDIAMFYDRKRTAASVLRRARILYSNYIDSYSSSTANSLMSNGSTTIKSSDNHIVSNRQQSI